LATVALGYNSIFRSLPELVVIFGAFFGLPALGLRISPFAAALVAMTLISTAYMAEIIRGGLEAVRQDQWEAAHSLGMTPWRTFSRIVLPQAIAVIIPTFISHATEVAKMTSLASLVGVGELTGHARTVVGVTHDPLAVFSFACVLYMAVNGALLAAESLAERRVRH
jgi:ABC-type amino acid transport system permease subunit